MMRSVRRLASLTLTWEDEDNPPAATACYNAKVHAPLMCALAHLLHSTRVTLGLSKPSGRVGGHSTHARARDTRRRAREPRSHDSVLNDKARECRLVGLL